MSDADEHVEIEPSSTVLVVVDMQNGFLGSRSSHVVGPVLALIDRLSTSGIPVVATRFISTPGSQWERWIDWHRLQASPEIDLVPEVEATATIVVDKPDLYTPFTDDFEDLVQRSHWTTMVICGVATDGCVLKTAVDAFERNIKPIVVADACASHAGEDVHNAGLMLARRFVGRGQVIDASQLKVL